MRKGFWNSRLGDMAIGGILGVLLIGVVYVVWYLCYYTNLVTSWLETCKNKLTAWKDKLRHKEGA